MVTNSDTEFFMRGIPIKMLTGDCWYINANIPHRAANYGNADRIHLVIDCKINNWLKEVFERLDKFYFP